MPIQSLIKLASFLGDPTAKVIWIHHTGRCGSTAMAQVCNALPNVLTISEPLNVFSLDQYFKYKHLRNGSLDWEPTEEYLKIYQSTVRVMLSKSYLKSAEIIVVKAAPANSMVDLNLIVELFPKFINVFMYREMREQVTSLYKTVSGFDIQRSSTSFIASSMILSRFFPNVKSHATLQNCCNDKKHVEWLLGKSSVHNHTEFIAFVISWCEMCSHYMKLCESLTHPNVPAFKYEHWQSNPDKYLETFFKLVDLELTDERLQIVKDVLNEDSQKNSMFSREKVKQRGVEIPKDMIHVANSYSKFYHLPKWGESFTLPNTVTSP
ncbi:hypothetical protein EB796_007671 [Bugula neritina]|uniref:Sulfotransferase domain-containing protein n=1 Tax=Bugula neritina TaxID=10212 RepID=A0A7J7K744_BUGNE|nr:hypothetical protein EB796_007671 [Bugula neritina]